MSHGLTVFATALVLFITSVTFHVLNLPPTVQLCEIHILFTFITANAESQGDLPDLVANTCGLIYGISCTILDRGSYDIRFLTLQPPFL